MISFSVDKEEAHLIQGIVQRVANSAYAIETHYARMDASMDLTACHANGCPLDLFMLLAAEDFDFFHDVFGIRRHLDRESGRLKNCFVPRCARRQIP